jgi:tetratricopeptide (TPR) repeat protein
MRSLWPRILTIALIGLAVSGPVAAQDAAEKPGSSELPPGLAEFIEARLLESSRDYRRAAELYAKALELNPDSTEIRVRYASLMADMGMAESAANLLDGVEDLDWYGLRVRALALTQLATRDPERLEEAEQALRAAVEDRTNDPNLQLSLAQVVHRLGKPEEAEAIVADLRAARVGSNQLVAYHAGLLRELGRIDEAAEAYGECMQGFPMAEMCRQNRVELLIALGRKAEAGDTLLEMLGEDDLDQTVRAAALLAEGMQPEKALEAVQRVLDSHPDSTRARTLEALILSALGRHREASDRFEKLVRKDKENVDLMERLAWSQALAGQYDEARKTIDRAWQVAQQDVGSSRAVSVCLTAARVELRGDHPRVAREWLDRVPDPSLADEELPRLLAESYRQAEQWSEGVAAMLRLQPRLPEPIRLEAVAFEAEFRLRGGDRRGLPLLRPLLDSDDVSRVGLGIQILQIVERWEDVEREAEQSLERFPSSTALMFTRAAALERLGRVEDSVAVFRQLLVEDPDNASAANYLGYIWADRGTNLEEALQLINRAVELEPDNPAYLDSLGWVHYRLGDLEQARHWLERAVAIDDGDGTLVAHLGEVLFEAGEIERARELLRQAINLGPEDADHVRGLLERIDELEGQKNEN